MEPNTFISCCYYPTTVFLVDDNKRFLDSTSIKIGRKIPHKTNTDPAKALNFLLKEYKPHFFVEKCLNASDEEYRDHPNIDVDVKSIHQEIYDPKRFEEISVVVVDYAMPGINGADFCKQLKNDNFKVILLTGEADEKIAIDLFNKDVIDRYIRKDIPELMNTLFFEIEQLQKNHFKTSSEIIISGLTKTPESRSCLNDPVFVEFFNDLCSKHEFTEYYLLDEVGSFLFLDAEGNPSCLLVRDEEEMQGALFDTEVSDTDVPAEIVEALKTREKLLYRHTRSDFEKEPAEWPSIMYPAKKLEGKQTYYYTYLKNPPEDFIERDKVLSYKKYLEAL